MAPAGNTADSGRHMQIGEAAERSGLSIRTIRHYDEAGLVVPSARSDGGFRLYTRVDLDRLAVIKRMKPLGFTLEEMRDLLEIVVALPHASAGDQTLLIARLEKYYQAAQHRVADLAQQLATAQGFADQLHEQLELHQR